METLVDLLRLTPGTISIIGSGGKTSLLYTLAHQLPGRVLLSTSTRIYPFNDIKTVNPRSTSHLKKLTQAYPLLCCASPALQGKLQAPFLPFTELAQHCDYLLIEADGSHHLPLKAHKAHEPVIPSCTNTVILVVGASGFNKPLETVVHHPEIFCLHAQINPSVPIHNVLATPWHVARVVNAEALTNHLFVNQVDSPQAMKQAQIFRNALGYPVVAGNLATHFYRLI